MSKGSNRRPGKITDEQWEEAFQNPCVVCDGSGWYADPHHGHAMRCMCGCAPDGKTEKVTRFSIEKVLGRTRK